MKRIIERRVYNTETAQEVCYNGVLNQDGRTRCTGLYKTKKGNFFLHHQTMWQGETDSIEPIPEDEAADFYETCSETSMTFEAAFPGQKIEEA